MKVKVGIWHFEFSLRFLQIHIPSLNIPTFSLCAESPTAFLLTTLTVIKLKCAPRSCIVYNNVLINIVLLTKNSRHWQPQVSSSVSTSMMNPTAGPHFGHSCFLMWNLVSHVVRKTLGSFQQLFISCDTNSGVLFWWQGYKMFRVPRFYST